MSGKSRAAQVLQYINWLTGLSFSLITPVFICIAGALWLKGLFNLGEWVVIAGIIFGIISGGCSFVSFAKYVQAQANKPLQK